MPTSKNKRKNKQSAPKKAKHSAAVAQSASTDWMTPRDEAMAIVQKAEQQGLKTVLHVGCGQKNQTHLPKPYNDATQWKEIRLDISPSTKPDIMADIMDMRPLADNSVDALFSSHNVEHVWPHQVQQVLTEFNRVLKLGAVAMITLPDMQAVAFHVAEGKLESPLYTSPSGPITALDIMYGHIKSLAKGQHYMAHKTGFTAETLGRRLVLAGFSTVTVARDSEMNLWATGYKIPKQHEKYSDDIQIRGRFSKAVVTVPNAANHQQFDNLDAEPQLWKPLGLK